MRGGSIRGGISWEVEGASAGGGEQNHSAKFSNFAFVFLSGAGSHDLI